MGSAKAQKKKKAALENKRGYNLKMEEDRS
jgi:hypothetical protein